MSYTADPEQVGLMSMGVTPGAPPITQAPPSYSQAVTGASNLDFVDFLPEKREVSPEHKEYDRFE